MTGLVHTLGIPLGPESDLMGPAPSNPKGHFESNSLSLLNEGILGLLGGAWYQPPELPDGWAQSAPMQALAAEARAAFNAVFTEPTWLWKDPRLCVTLPFWRMVLGDDNVAILVVRHPLEVARSLESLYGSSLGVWLDLWEVYNRRAVLGLKGLPVFVTTYEALLKDPREWLREVSAFLSKAGLQTTDPPRESIDDFIDRSLRHTSFGVEELRDDQLTDAQRILYETLVSRLGVHSSL